MSVLIKGMKMSEKPTFGCWVVNIYANGQVRDAISCKLLGRAVEVPTPHGRLIDADTMKKEIKRWKDHPNKYIRNRNKDFIFYLNNAETVIEAEVEE